MTIQEGDIFRSNQGCLLTVIKYVNARNIYIALEEGNTVKVEASQLRKGTYINRNKPTVYGVGNIGYGKYSAKANGKLTKEYISWFSMLTRCYNVKQRNLNPTYEDCYVCEEWLNFQNFSKWYSINNIDGFELDKDILVRGNKIYGPRYCCFVPKEINTLLNRKQKSRGKYCIGVTYLKDRNKFVAQASQKDKTTNFLGFAETEEEAFFIYKEFKEAKIKEYADLYKSVLHPKVYEALYNYKVSMED